MLCSKEESAQTLLRKYIPSHRFIQIEADTIDRNHVLRSDLNRRSVKVVNWNIAKNNHDARWLNDFLWIVEQFRPDIIFLQEVHLRVEAEHAVDLPEMSWSFAPNFLDAHHRAYAGVLTAAKTNAMTSQAIITPHYEPIVQTPKVSLLTEYPLSDNGQTLLAINSHLINFVNLDKFKVQLHELETAIARHPGPVIFAGDFNTWNQPRAVLLNEVARRLGLTPVSYTPHESRKIKRFLLSPALDYIFYRGLRERTASSRVLARISSSDHKPLLAEFFVKD